MLPTAARRAATVASHKCAEDTSKIINIIAKHGTPLAPNSFQSAKAIRKRLDVKRKARTKTEEQTLSWWLDRRDPLEIFKSDDAHVVPGRKSVLERVQSVIRKHYGADYPVATFGSVRYGAASAKSDMDLIILDPKRKNGFDPQKEQLSSIYRIESLAAKLRYGGFTEVEAIPASVPIVKFKDPVTGIYCDLNVNDQPGYWNSIMLGRYATLCPHLPKLLLAIKRWSRPIGLNSPSPKTAKTPVSFSSYAYALMTVGFLQHLGLLPNLQEKIPPDIGSRYFWNRKPRCYCDLRFKWQVPPISANMGVSASSLFLDWFNFWAEFDPDKHMVDICQGGIVPRKGGDYSLVVVDPFIRVRSVTRNVSKNVFAGFQKECGAASAELRARSERSGYVIV